jgi:hypothetical protein
LILYQILQIWNKQKNGEFTYKITKSVLITILIMSEESKQKFCVNVKIIPNNPYT